MVSKIIRADGTTELASIQSVTYHESVNADTDLRPGCVASNYIEVTCFGAQSDAPDVGEALTYYQVVGETETLIGIFYAEPSIPTKNSYSFVAYDAVHKLDADFSAWLSAHQDDFPYTVYQLVSQACTIAGVTLGTSSWDHSTMSVNAWYADGLTCRNILQYAAEIACKFVRCHSNGQIYFDWYSAVSNQRIYPSSGTSGSEERFAYKQDGLTYDNYDTSAVVRVAVHPVGEDEVAYYYPANVTSGNTLNITNNALLYGASSTDMLSIAQSIYTTMTAFGTYRPMSVDMFPNECPFRTGDIVPVTDAQGVSFTTAIMEKTVTDSAVTLTSTGREVYGDYALDTAKQLVQLASDIVRINKLKVGWAEIDEAVVGVLTSHGMNPDEVVVSANTVTEYYLSTSSSSATGGSWGTSIPTWSSGKYVWTRDKTTNEYADGTSSTSYSPSQNGVYDANLTTALSTAASASSAASTAQSTANGANAREQTIYISKASGTSSVSGNTVWVTDATGGQNAWTTKRPVYNSSYPVLFIAQQSQTVSQYNGGSGIACSCTTPVKDDTTTVIDGGHITTGSIDANRITTGALTIRDSSNNIIFQADASNKTVQIGGWTVSDTALSSVYANRYRMDLTNGIIRFTDTQYSNARCGIIPYFISNAASSGMMNVIFENTSGETFDAEYMVLGVTRTQTYTAIDVVANSSDSDPIKIYLYGRLQLGNLTGVGMTNDVATMWRNAIGAVNKAGDTMTGDLTIQKNDNPFLYLKSLTADSSASTSSANIYETLAFYDKNGLFIGYIQSILNANGNSRLSFGARRKVSGSDATNGFEIAITNTGAALVSITHPAAWRSALGIGGLLTVTDTALVSAAKSIANNTWTVLNSITFSAGTWAVWVSCRFAANATGRRGLAFTTSQPSTRPGVRNGTVVGASPNDQTLLEHSTIFRFSSSTTYYAYALQQSGGNLNVEDAYIRYIKLCD